ncbi:mitochondrial inner membrane i-AAA protease complex subunit Yme1 [Protomyces lactucae-debilis]|uniref:Mitochondrial inner membrane i-AAA protease complex subunit Yme1 n=1 Tax=Protomyces lactucae-debilis TaxID=2754530 RepID=A0A1Y2FH76_PROLT|nr:mitochondrial inner membrane i-AAA protease complex subunit Yme1 [Protomyces lactucae-debilis]ORY83311.1 mitochondrial inner membrane i-AAA protease complex subunit Yme1 [Protomyces lactucae-debilis]
MTGSAQIRCGLWPFQSRSICEQQGLASRLLRAASFSTSRDYDIKQLERRANLEPDNSAAQASLYKVLRREDPELAIRRFTSGRYSKNSTCEEYYADALEHTGRVREAEQVRDQLLEPSQPRSRHDAQVSSAITTASDALGATRQNPLHVVMQQSRATIILEWVRFLLSFGLTVYIVLLVIGTVASAAGMAGNAIGGLDGSGKRQAAVKELPDVRFSDVHGVDEAKEELQDVVNFLKNPSKFTTLGGKLPKGVLLTGPPGTGKTLLARAIAGEANVPFFFMSGSDFDEMFVGVGAKRIRELFAQAKEKAPSIVFIDELDAVGSKRNPKDSAYLRQTLNQLLVELDGFQENSGVVFIGATNFPQSLDKALIRPGRFDVQINVPLPDVRGRMQILQHHARKMRMAPEVDFSLIARGTSGFSGADLANLVNQAAIKASKDMAKLINMKSLEWAKDRIMMGAERKSKYTTEESKLMTAWHEAGHALVAFKTPGAMEPYKATIMPRGFSLGMTMMLPEMDKDSRSKKEYQAMIDVSMGGRVAELLIYGPENVTSGAHSDITNATNIAKEMVTAHGFSSAVGSIALSDNLETLSPSTKALVESEIKSMITSAEERAHKILTTYSVELERLAKALVEYEILNKQEMEMVMKGEKLSR